MTDPAASDPGDAELLLRYAQVTYAAVTQQRRRLGVALLVVAAVFGVVATFSAVRWVSTAQAVDDVADRPLVEALGVSIPDPRPAIERAELRMRAFGWAVVAVGAALIALLAGGVAALVRPTPLPPELRRFDGDAARGQPRA